MYLYQKHYHDVVQRDLILSGFLLTVSAIPVPKKINLALGGDSSDENYVVSSATALKILTNQKPIYTRHKLQQGRGVGSTDVVGTKLTIRGSKIYFFLHKLLFEVFPRLKQFEGLRPPENKNVYCFLIKDIFAFQELVPLFSSFEDLGGLQCQFHFTTKTKSETLVLGSGLQFCFIS